VLRLPKTLENLVIGLTTTAFSLGGFTCAKSPTKPENQNNTQDTGTEIKATNSDGEITFSDGTPITIINSNTYQPVNNVLVRESFSPDYKVFDARHQNYVSNIIFPNGDRDNTIPLTPLQNGSGTTTIGTINNQTGEIMYDWRSNNNMEYSRHTYLRTIDRDEYINGTQRLIGFLSLIGEGMLSLVGANLPGITLENLASQVNWDPQHERYDMFKFEGSTIPTSFDFVPSNIPWVNLGGLQISEDNEVTLGFSKNDRIYYEELPNYIQVRNDPTIHLGDDPDFPDLETRIQFTTYSTGSQTAWFPWDTSPFQTGSLNPGDYMVAIKITDEVGNESIKEVEFSIEEDEEEIYVLVTYNYNATGDGVGDIVWANGNFWSTTQTSPTEGWIHQHRGTTMAILESYPWPKTEYYIGVGGIAWDGNNFLMSDRSTTNKFYRMPFPPTEILSEHEVPTNSFNIQSLTYDGNSFFGFESANMYGTDLHKFDQNLNITESYPQPTRSGKIVFAEGYLWATSYSFNQGPLRKLEIMPNGQIDQVNQYQFPLPDLEYIGGLAYYEDSFYMIYTTTNEGRKIAEFRVE
jgi:hypothetical protein